MRAAAAASSSASALRRGAMAGASGARAAPPRFMLVTDLDLTLVDPEDASHAALRRFNAVWRARCARDCRLVFSTGRSRAKYMQLRVR